MADGSVYTPRLKELYDTEIRGKMREEFGYKNDLMIPKLDKIVLNMGVGDATQDTKRVKVAFEELKLIAGQQPVTTFEFLDRLIMIAMPRIRDFRGVKGNAFDGRGNYAMGVKEQIIFPEIDYDKVDKIRGLDIVIGTTAKTDAEAKALLRHFNMPFSN